MEKSLTMDDLLREILRLRKGLHQIASPSFKTSLDELELHKMIVEEKEMLARIILSGGNDGE